MNNSSSDIDRCIMTMAYGNTRYVNMAKSLARSLKYHKVERPYVIVTDSTDPELEQLFDILIPYQSELGQPLLQKLFLNEYSPFSETLFIDSDCLVIRDLNQVWNFFQNISFGVIGNNLQSGNAFGVEVLKLRETLGLALVPVFNGGLYYFKKSEDTNKIFQQARDLIKDYDSLGFPKIRGMINEEPLISLSLALRGIQAIEDEKGLTMRSTIDMKGWLWIDIVNGQCNFIKTNIKVNPAIVHFADNTCQLEYKREQLKLRLIERFQNRNYPLISMATNLLCEILFQHERFKQSSRDLLRKILRAGRRRAAKVEAGSDDNYIWQGGNSLRK